MVVLEELEHALARGAKIYAEVTGYGATSDGHDMVAPSGEGAERCMKIALEMAGNPRIDYLNPHGTSTPVGDSKEMGAVRNVFGDAMPMISSTKSLTGHSLGAAGVHEAIYCLLMMERGFIAGSANVGRLDPAATAAQGEADGGGPVDATFKAIESIAGSGAELLLYSVNAITTGTDAQGEVTTRLAKAGRIVNGNGADTDIVIASAKAYINGVNKLGNTLSLVFKEGREQWPM